MSYGSSARQRVTGSAIHTAQKPGPWDSEASHPIKLHLYAVDFDAVAVHGPADRDLVAGMLLHLVLVGYRVNLALFGYENGRVTLLHAALSALLIGPHCLLAGAGLVHDVAG